MAQRKHEARKQNSQALVEFGENLSPNFIQKAVGTVTELKAEYDLHDAAINAGVKKYTDATDDLFKHLSDMQSLLSKHGVNHRLVIEARKQGHNIPWWTEYYGMYDGILKESLRTMQSRLKAYRAGELGDEKKNEKKDTTYRFNKAAANTAVAGLVAGRELADAIEAGRDGKEELKAFRKIQHGDRLNDIIAAAEAEPDWKKLCGEAMRGLDGVLAAFERDDVNKALPADLRKVVREARNEFFPKAKASKADGTAKKSKSAVADLLPPRQGTEPLPKTAPPIKVKQAADPEKPTLAALVTVVTAKPGFTCKHNGTDYEVAAVSDDGMSADLKSLRNGSDMPSIPVAELRYVVGPDAVEAA